jgi:hypothetical protein
MIEECLEAVEEDTDGEVFTAWEITFLESVEEANEEGHLTPDQVVKLEQIYEDRVCNQ